MARDSVKFHRGQRKGAPGVVVLEYREVVGCAQVNGAPLLLNNTLRAPLPVAQKLFFI